MTNRDHTIPETGMGNEGLERVFPKGHRFYDRIFYDTYEGKYYDRSTDFYLELEEARAFGVKC